MNTQEARALLDRAMAGYHIESYGALQRLLRQPDRSTVTGPSGVRYQLVVEALWDAAPGGLLRLIGSIDDGGLRAFAPLSADLLVAPDGTFVGERP